MSEEITQATEQSEQAIAPVHQDSSCVPTMWNNNALMRNAWKTADMLSKTSIIPQQYRGRTGECLIAIDMGNRIGISPIVVMQYSQVVQGNFTWKGSACKALIDGCGKFVDSRYVIVGQQGEPSWGCYLSAVRRRTGETVNGPVVTWKMATDEGWVNKNGSKWKTMPDLMLRYRAAAFFARTECPEVLMGFQTCEEVQDVRGYEEPSEQVTTVVLDAGEVVVDAE